MSRYLYNRWMWLVIGIFVIAGLVAFAVIQNQPRPVDLTIDDLRQNAVFPEVRVLDILTINLRDPDSELQFTLTRAPDGTWTTAQPGTLDAEAASEIARTIVLLPVVRTLAVDTGGDLSQYGFAPNGTIFIQFLTTDEIEHGLAIGGFLPDRSGFYALVDDRPDLYIIPRGPVDYLINALVLPPVTPAASPDVTPTPS